MRKPDQRRSPHALCALLTLAGLGCGDDARPTIDSSVVDSSTVDSSAVDSSMTPDVRVVPGQVQLLASENVEASMVGSLPAGESRLFSLIRVTIVNGLSEPVLLNPALFAIRLGSGLEIPASPATAMLDGSCPADARVSAGRTVECRLAFEIDRSATEESLILTVPPSMAFETTVPARQEPNVASDRCDDENIRVITETTEDLRIDTRELGPDVDLTSRCGVSSGGADGFIAVDVQAFDTWHFHLQVRGAVGRNPSLYLLRSNGFGGCMDAVCEEASDSCTGAGEEHLSFLATEDERWFIGIDDGEAGGAEYSLSATRSFCDGTLERGEACDGSPECTSDCRVRLSTENMHITSVQRNFVQAAAVVIPPAGSLTVTGSIGDAEGLCDYPDVFTLVIPAGGADLAVRPSSCASGADAPYDFVLRSALGRTLASRDRNANDCPLIERSGAERLPEGQYFVEVDGLNTEVSNYELVFQVTP